MSMLELTRPPALGQRLALVPLLIASTFMEVALNRVGLHMTRSGSALFRVVDRGGMFFYFLTGLLAIAVFTWAVLVLIRDRDLLGPLGRTTMAIVGAPLLPLAGLALVYRLSPALAPFLNVAFGVFIICLVGAFVLRPATARAKLGVLYLALPLVLHCYWLLTQQVPSLAPTGTLADLPSRLFEAGEHLVVVGAFAAFLFFAPFPRAATFFEPVPMGVALLLTAIAATALQASYPQVAQIAYYGFGISMPSPSLQGAIHLTALFFFLLTVVGLLLREGPPRTTGLGLLVIALSGFQLKLPHQLLLTAVGMVALVRAALAAPTREALGAPIAAEQLKRFVDRIAFGPAEARETVALHHEHGVVVRGRGEIDGVPALLRLHASVGGLDELELALGNPPSGKSPASLVRTKGRRGRRVAGSGGPRVAFDPRFVLRDGTASVAEALMSDGVRQQLATHLHGCLAIYPQEGLRYTARPAADGWPLPLAALGADAESASTADVDALAAALIEIGGRLGVLR